MSGFILKKRAKNYFAPRFEGGKCCEVKIKPKGRRIAAETFVLRLA